MIFVFQLLIAAAPDATRALASMLPFGPLDGREDEHGQGQDGDGQEDPDQNHEARLLR